MKPNWFKEFLIFIFMFPKFVWQFGVILYQLSRLQGSIIAIFGGGKAYKGGKYQEQAYAIAQQCVEHGMSIITGGGPGIMVGANCGAYDKAQELGLQHKTLGIEVKGVDSDFVNPCAPVYSTNYFFMRKWLLINYSCAFIIFPGGIGTVDEIFEVLNLIKTGKMQKVPVVLFDSEYWQPIIQWYDKAVDKQFILDEYKDLFIVTDDIKKAVAAVRTCAK